MNMLSRKRSGSFVFRKRINGNDWTSHSTRFIVKRKCKDKIKDIISAGTTVLYVSHNAESVREICPRSIYLRKGTVIHDGPTDETLKVYQDYKASLKKKK